jgi:hypothetical protein
VSVCARCSTHAIRTLGVVPTLEEAGVAVCRRDAQADRDRVEQLRERWGSWQGALDEDPVLARQLLKKILATPIYVRPTGRRQWTYVGIGRYDRLLNGNVAPGFTSTLAVQPRNRTEALTMFLMSVGVSLDAADRAAAPIAGGSDAHPAGCKTPSVNSGPPMSNESRRGSGSRRRPTAGFGA